MASVRQRKKKRKKAQSCASLRRRATRIRNKKKRKAALKKLPKRCKPAKRPTAPEQIVTGSGTTPSTTKPSPPAPGGPSAPPVPPPAGPLTTIDSPIAVYSGPWGRRQAERLWWRAGFGPRPGDADASAAAGMEAAVLAFTRPSGQAPMDGPEPTDDEGRPLRPYAEWGHDHTWWFDRMVRSGHPLVERMTLVLHDWFATSNDGVGSAKMMFDQSNLFRTYGLGNFKSLVREITYDPAMLLWLSGVDNSKWGINENYARELMELFCLGADRGAYTETDVRELARAMTGWTGTWTNGVGWHSFRWDETNRWDPTTKTLFGETGRLTWEDGVRLVLAHPMHPSFVVRKLWSYFIPEPPSAEVSAALEQRYVETGGELRPLIEAILCSPWFYEGGRMVKPTVVFAAGMLRQTRQYVTTTGWAWMCAQAGQQLFYPPDVSGWDDEAWLDTSTMAGRWTITNQVLGPISVQPSNQYPAETPDAALAAARAFLGDPDLTDEAVAYLSSWAAGAVAPNANGGDRSQRQNALRQLIAMSPDHLTC